MLYLNNFTECHRDAVDAATLEKRLFTAMEFMEKARSEGKIRSYGLSSWQSLRVPAGHKAHTDIEQVVKMAEKVGGKGHGFKYLQLPVELDLPR